MVHASDYTKKHYKAIIDFFQFLKMKIIAIKQ